MAVRVRGDDMQDPMIDTEHDDAALLRVAVAAEVHVRPNVFRTLRSWGIQRWSSWQREKLAALSRALASGGLPEGSVSKVDTPPGVESSMSATSFEDAAFFVSQLQPSPFTGEFHDYPSVFFTSGKYDESLSSGPMCL